MKTAAILGVLVTIAWIGGCGRSTDASEADGGDSDVDAGSDVDTDTSSDVDAGSDAGTDGGTDASDHLVCPPEPAASCDEVITWPLPYVPFASATDFGDGLEFVSVAGDPPVYLAARTSGGGAEPVVVVADMLSEAFVAIEPAAPLPGDPRPVDIVSVHARFDAGTGLDVGDEVFGYGIVALLCEPAGACALYGVPAVHGMDTPVFEPIASGEVPLPDARVLLATVTDPWDTSIARVCALGDGVACFDGSSWTVEIQPDGALLLGADGRFPVPGSAELLFAAGEGGRVLVEGTDEWVAPTAVTATDLVSASASYGLLAAGGDGVLLLADETLEFLACPFGDGPLVLLLIGTQGSDPEVTIFTASGRVIETWFGTQGAESCAYDDPLDGEALALTTYSVPDAYETIVVTRDTAYRRGEGGGFD
jgi:hypothetical protein